MSPWSVVSGSKSTVEYHANFRPRRIPSALATIKNPVAAPLNPARCWIGPGINAPRGPNEPVCSILTTPVATERKATATVNRTVIRVGISRTRADSISAVPSASS